MTRDAALYNFFSDFGMTAYPATAVPAKADFPYITYETTGGDWGTSVSIAVNLWFHTESEAFPNAKVTQISEAVGLGGKIIPHDNGMIWVTRGNPWVQAFADETDNSFKRRQLILILEDWRT